MPVFHRRRPFAAGCASVALVGALSSPAWAEPAPAYAQLLSRLDQTPAAVEALALQDAAEARVRQARSRPNPVLALEVENALGSGPYSGLGAADATATITQDLELWGRRSARIEAARSDAGAATARRDLVLAETAGRLALFYAEAEAAQRRAELAHEILALTIEDARAALVLVEEGREPLLRGVQGESEAAAARAAADEARAERDAAFARLTAAALLQTPVTSIESSLLDQPARSVGKGEDRPPAVRLAEAEQAAAERRIRVELIQARPDISATMGVRRFSAEDATAFTIGLSLPLPLFDRNRGDIAAAQAEYRAASARLAGARQDAQAERAAAEARLRASASRVHAADAGVSSAEEAYRLSRIGFEAGRISQLELRVTRTALVTARAAAVDARLARVRAEIDLARQDGRAPFEGLQ